MAARSGTVPWFESFDVDAEVGGLLAHIERCTGFALPERQRDVIMTHLPSRKARQDKAGISGGQGGGASRWPHRAAPI